MQNIITNTETILTTASPQENRIINSILDNLKENFSVAHDQNKLQEFMREYMVGIIAINQRAGILPDVEFESEFEGNCFQVD